MEPLTLLAGAALAVAGWLVGHLTGRRAERHRLDKPQEPICGCTHHLAAYVGPEPISSVWVPPVAREAS